MKKPFLKSHYEDVVVPELMKTQGYKNRHQVPVIQKVVLNSGVSAASDKNWITEVAGELTKISSQKAVVTKARKSISNFKLRQGMPIGAKVTLRGDRMYDFIYRLLVVALPAIRDFRGVSRKLDSHGNYNIGISDHSIFPEVNVDGNRATIGLDLTIVTSAKTDDEARALLDLMGMPFRKVNPQTTQAA
ncbi:MAG TPA: 50S ribosomal protein L5 [Opitutae bacterium]|nr:50S ribosomal protein L5 [Opitutae bacterium]|tara:strand:+ start:2059 stop:2625 length:567 start_codon:yes stop_codon:yes gene_type:complete